MLKSLHNHLLHTSPPLSTFLLKSHPPPQPFHFSTSSWPHHILTQLFYLTHLLNLPPLLNQHPSLPPPQLSLPLRHSIDLQNSYSTPLLPLTPPPNNSTLSVSDSPTYFLFNFSHII